MYCASIKRQINLLRRQLKTFPSNPGPEETHKLRTRIRRILAFATVAPQPPKPLLKSILAIRKAAGRVRDLDVITGYVDSLSKEHNGASTCILLRRLDKRRDRALTQLEKTLDRHRKSSRKALLRYIGQIRSESTADEHFDTSLSTHAQSHIAESRFELTHWPEPDESNLHDLRLKAKHLRTLVQLFQPSEQEQIKSLGDLTGQIGQWHDWLVLATLVHRVMDIDKDSDLIGVIDQFADLHFERALQSALSLRAQHAKGVAAATPKVTSILPGRVA